MDKEKKIINRLKELADLIKKHNYNYHTLDKPTISDKEFVKADFTTAHRIQFNLYRRKFPIIRAVMFRW